MNYRSRMNASFSPFLFEMRVNAPNGGPEVGEELSRYVNTYGDDVPGDRAARLEKIGSTVNEGRQFGPRVIVIELREGPFRDATLQLDRFWFKNVIIQNTKVAFHGGPVSLENAYFIDCQFQMENLPPNRALAEELLAGASVSFD
jgi:hypothetical protein